MGGGPWWGAELAADRGEAGEGGSSSLDVSEQGLDSPWLGWEGRGGATDPRGGSEDVGDSFWKDKQGRWSELAGLHRKDKIGRAHV